MAYPGFFEFGQSFRDRPIHDGLGFWSILTAGNSTLTARQLYVHRGSPLDLGRVATDIGAR